MVGQAAVVSHEEARPLVFAHVHRTSSMKVVTTHKQALSKLYAHLLHTG